jgi:phenylacetate-CoA ligase
VRFNSLSELVAIARSGSPFYRSLYRDVPECDISLPELPIARFSEVMAAVHDDYRALVASRDAYGICYTTSGTTGHPKETLFGRDEWRTAHEILSLMHFQSGALRDGDVVLNLSEPGSASFMAIHRVVDTFPGRCSEIPIGCDVGFATVAKVAEQFRATVIAGMSPTLLGLAEWLLRKRGGNLCIHSLLGGGELLYGTQRSLLQVAFPEATFCAFMYGAAEAGLIGYGEPSLPHNQVRVLDAVCKLEIVCPERFTPITEVGRIGRVVITNFLRVASPALRLETGDLAMWHDSPTAPNPRISLHGRLFPFALDVMGLHLCEDQVFRLLRLLEAELPLLKVQLVLKGSMETPVVIVRLAVSGDTPAPLVESCVRRAFGHACPALAASMSAGDLPPLVVETVPLSFFEEASRRKSRLILDLRERLGVLD